jgi:hypothetical protein
LYLCGLPKRVLTPTGSTRAYMSFPASNPRRNPRQTRHRGRKGAALARRVNRVGTVTNVEQIAFTENCTVRQANMTILLAFLAPNLVQAAVDGRLPRGVGIANLRDAPAAWSLQSGYRDFARTRPR